MEVVSRNVSPAGLMSIQQVADYMGLPEGAVRRMRRLDRIPFRLFGAKLYARQTDVDEYIEGIFGNSS